MEEQKTTNSVPINSELNIKLEDVIERFAPPMQEKIRHSIELLQKSERLAQVYDPEDHFFLAFSGGKDSQCLYHVAKLAGVKFKAHMSLTSVDPPEVIRFVRKHYPDVELIKPKRSIFQSAIDRKILPTMRVRWCCAEYKEATGAGKVTLIGIRHAESSRRAGRNEVEINNRKFSGNLEELEQYRKDNNHVKKGRKSKGYKETTIVNADGERVLGCIRGQESLLISPIIHWSDSDVWTFLNTLGIAHCELYDQGWHRIGCIGCPMSQSKQKVIENKRWPHVKRNWIKAIKAIRQGGGIQKRIYLVEHPSRPHSLQERREQAQGGVVGSPNPRYVINSEWLQTPSQFLPKEHLPHQRQRTNTGLLAGFSDSSSSDRLTEEQENEIAENIYDWWISGKSYKRWYAEKFLQTKLDFKDE